MAGIERDRYGREESGVKQTERSFGHLDCFVCDYRNQ